MNGNQKPTICTRRGFLAAAVAPIALTGVTFAGAGKPNDASVASPNRRIKFSLQNGSSDLNYRVTLRNKPVIEASKIGITVDGAALGAGADIRKVESYRGRENYAWRGVHST